MRSEGPSSGQGNQGGTGNWGPGHIGAEAETGNFTYGMSQYLHPPCAGVDVREPRLPFPLSGGWGPGALQMGTPSSLLCREQQVAAMSSWLDQHLVDGSPGSIYVSGTPGTGKTATIVSLLKGKVAKYRSIFINCMVLKSAIAIYREVATQLNPKSNPKTEKAALKTIEEAITDTEEMTLLVLDEVDQLDSKDQSVLYTVFEWPALQGSRLALIGIANSLDLTDRVLPRLQVKEAHDWLDDCC